MEENILNIMFDKLANYNNTLTCLWTEKIIEKCILSKGHNSYNQFYCSWS